MGKYNSAIITTEGINMFASAIGGGETVTFMTMQASSHAYPSTTDFMSLTSLQDVEATVNVNYAGVYSNNIVQVSARFDNDGVSTAYLINTLGLFAKLGNGEPKLVAVVTAQTPDQMPVYDANNPSAFIYNLQCTVQNAGSMAVSVNPAGTVTVEQFNEEMATKLGRTDNAVSATKLQTSRSLTVDLGSTTAASFDGSADASIGVSGELPIANGGTGASTQAGARSALGVPPTNHAVANTTYGSGTATNYGHVKLSDTYDTVGKNADAAHGVGASQNALANAYRNLQPQIDNLEPRVSSSEQALTVNLLNPILASQTRYGITVTRNADNTYTFDGVFTSANDTAFILQEISAIGFKDGTKYKLIGDPSEDPRIAVFIGSLNRRTSREGMIITPPFGGTKVYIKVFPGADFTEPVTIKPMITTNLSATYDDYIPYSGSSGKLDTDYKTLHDAIDTKAPTNHAAANTTYGSGTSTNYGHVKLSDTYDTVEANADAAHGVAASQNALAQSYQSFDERAKGGDDFAFVSGEYKDADNYVFVRGNISDDLPENKNFYIQAGRHLNGSIHDLITLAKNGKSARIELTKGNEIYSFEPLPARLGTWSETLNKTVSSSYANILSYTADAHRCINTGVCIATNGAECMIRVLRHSTQGNDAIIASAMCHSTSMLQPTICVDFNCELEPLEYVFVQVIARTSVTLGDCVISSNVQWTVY